MSETDVNSILIDVESTLQNELLVVINTTLSVDDVRQWFINDKVLTVVVDKPIVKVDFGERLKDDIRASIANGDWIPPKLRTLADNM
jgi:exoribonuclease II